MARLSLHVPEMTCRHQVRLVTGRLRDLAGVTSVEVDVGSEMLVVEGSTTLSTLRAALAGLELCRGGDGHATENGRSASGSAAAAGCS